MMPLPKAMVSLWSKGQADMLADHYKRLGLPKLGVRKL